MCGRTAQTQATVRTAASSMCAAAGGRICLLDKIGSRVESASGSSSTSGTKNDGELPSHVDSSSSETKRHEDEKAVSSQVKEEHDNNVDDVLPKGDGAVDEYPWRDNYNLSPGHDCVVFRLNDSTTADNTTGAGTTQTLEMDRKCWGLVVKGGTESAPVPSGASKHFANLMFNARSDTLFTKPTFARLLSQKRSCVVAVDGFFEWKAEAAGVNKGKKQPYFVYRKSEDGDDKKKPLLMAGLWTTVNTGWKSPQPPTLDTFTILTTEVCDSLKWLHSRMPVCIYDEALALEWLQNPTPQVHQKLDRMAHNTPDGVLAWHAVHPQMSKTQYRGADAIKAMPKPKSITSFFAPISKKTTGSSPTKVSPSNKRKGQQHEQQKDSKKKASIASFFQKKDPR